MTYETEIPIEITQADIAAAEKQAKKSYQTLYDYEMDLRKSFAAHRNRATTVCDCDPSSAKENKAGGIWYRRWHKAQHEVMDLQKRLDAMAEALTPSEETKAAYMSEFQFNIELRDEEGNSIWEPYFVPWATIKEIMAAIKKRAHEQQGDTK